MSVFERLVGESRIISFIGTGGVGKTTFSMTAAVAAAQAGKKVAAITIDPSRRLSKALGIGEDVDGPQPLDWKDLEGELDVFVLNTEATFREFVSSQIPERFRKGMLENKIFQQIAKNLRETHNFAAIYKLYQINRLDDYDLIILDTPPAQAAIDFFEAPEQLRRFFSFDGFQKLESKKWVSWLGDKSLSVFKVMVQKLAGGEFLEEMIQFFSNVKGLQDEVDKVTTQLIDQMSGPDCHFVLVTTGADDKLQESIYLIEQLKGRGFTTEHCIVNQAYYPWLEDVEAASLDGPSFAEDLFRYYHQQRDDSHRILERMQGHETGEGKTMEATLMPIYSFEKFGKKEVLELSKEIAERW